MVDKIDMIDFVEGEYENSLLDEVFQYQRDQTPGHAFGGFDCFPMGLRIQDAHEQSPAYSLEEFKSDFQDLTDTVPPTGEGSARWTLYFKGTERKPRLEFVMEVKKFYQMVVMSDVTTTEEESQAAQYLLDRIPDEFDIEQEEMEEYLETTLC